MGGRTVLLQRCDCMFTCQLISFLFNDCPLLFDCNMSKCIYSFALFTIIVFPLPFINIVVDFRTHKCVKNILIVVSKSMLLVDTLLQIIITFVAIWR